MATQIFLECSPRNLGKMKIPNLTTSIFFKWVGGSTTTKVLKHIPQQAGFTTTAVWPWQGREPEILGNPKSLRKRKRPLKWPKDGCIFEKEKYVPRWWQLKYFFMFTPKIGEDFQFDEHIFQMGWNHQLGPFFEGFYFTVRLFFLGGGGEDGVCIYHFKMCFVQDYFREHIPKHHILPWCS